MKRFILSCLHFSRRERLGTIVLTLVCSAVFALPEVVRWCYPRKTTDFSPFQKDIQAFRNAIRAAETTTGMPGEALFPFDPNTASAADFVQLGLPEKVANTICNYRDKGGVFRKPEDFQKIRSLSKEDYERLLPYIRLESVDSERFEAKQVAEKFELFAFDPNAATENDFHRLGLPARTIRSILNYRAKGGFFRKREDFKKIYTLQEDDFARLEPYIVFESKTASVESQRTVPFSGSIGENAAPKFAARGPLDINRADAEDWQRLPGIGEKRAQQIVRFRESLGGFLSIGQLGEMYGLPDSVFQKIRPMLTMHEASIRKINLNAVSEADLDNHPYISLKQAKLIVAYRIQHGPFSSADDLAKIAAFTDKKWLEKIRPYLEAK